MTTNAFLNLPVVAGNGAGASVDTSSLAATKTIIVGGPFSAVVTIEYSTSPTGALWAPVPNGAFTSNPGRVVVALAAQRMRTVTSNYVGGVPNVDVGAAATPAAFVQLSTTPVDISALPAVKTVVVSGACIVEISEDGTSYSQLFNFTNAGGQSAVITGQFARINNGVTAWIGGADVGSDNAIGGRSVLTWGADVLPSTEGDGNTFLGPGRTASAPVGDIMQLPAPVSGVLSRLFVRHNLASADTHNVVYTVLVNGAPTGMTVTLAGNNVLTSGDTTHVAAVDVGDNISIRAFRANEAAGSITLNVVATLVIEPSP